MSQCLVEGSFLAITLSFSKFLNLTVLRRPQGPVVCARLKHGGSEKACCVPWVGDHGIYCPARVLVSTKGGTINDYIRAPNINGDCPRQIRTYGQPPTD